ncbi:uncharacterized protein LOC121406065 [Lytechinus variegatus]|uniref:uncharacterized protein LOC121406065 n=1 Tax=Lytechinus variegatus TaxID=7654 RepID=UPI001BB0E86D|nr:uncharacterized protein LOC121406065 [Lytechinus variegatus]
MASKIVLLIFTVVMVTALVAAETFDDLTDDDLNEMEALIFKRADSNEADIGMEFDDDEMEKRGRGKGRGKFFRCTHPLNGFSCVCDRRYRKSNPKYYRVCGHQ